MFFVLQSKIINSILNSDTNCKQFKIDFTLILKIVCTIEFCDSLSQTICLTADPTHIIKAKKKDTCKP